jgi:hypothetical protein
MSGTLRPWVLSFTGAASLLALGGLLNAGQTTGQTAPAQTVAGQAQITAAKYIPYSAEETSETTRTLADGTQITQRTLTKIFRDSEGRTRTEHYVTENGASQPESDSPRFIDIVDRVAGVRYALNTRDHTARRLSLTPPPVAPQSQQKQTKRASLSAEAIPTEDLGEQEIEGVTAHGIRITRTIPVGAQGNDRPIVITDELWTSPELQRAVLTNRHDPLRGDTTTRLTNIVREEPSPDLFQVPADYTITEEQPVRAGIAPSE